MLTQRRRHQEQKRGFTDSSISKLASSHYNFTVLKNQTKKNVFLHLFEILSTIPFLSGGKELVHKEGEG